MIVKCYWCKKRFSSGEAINESSGSRRYGGSIKRVWYCHPCHKKWQKQKKKEQENSARVFLTILFVIFGVFILGAFLDN